MRKALSGKADSVFSYRNANPYSVMFDKMKREATGDFDENFWQQAANKGELDQYINLLQKNPNESAKLKELTSLYGKDRLDYDTTMLALSYDAITDDTSEERFDSAGNSLGVMSQKELINKVLLSQTLQWDNQLLEDAKHSDQFWGKLGNISGAVLAETVAFGADLISGAARVSSDAIDTIQSGVYTLGQVIQGRAKNIEDISRAYAQAASGEANADSLEKNYADTLNNVSEWLTEAGYDLRRKYSYSIDPATGEYKLWGKILHGMADSIGYMGLAMVGGGPAGMYVPMFTRNVKENAQLMGPNTDYTKVMTNAASKAAVEYAVELALGKVLGFTKLDKLVGYSDDALRVTQQTVIKGATSTTKQALAQAGKLALKDAFKEGTEEVLQEASGIFIDYLYGDKYADRGKEAANLENFAQAFIIGAATSIAIGGVSTLVVTNQTGVGTDGLTYKMGKFQSVAYNQATATLASWQAIANNAKADVNDRITAALKLEGVVATLGTLYESVGTENAVKAESLLLEIQAYHAKKAAIKQQVKNGTYVNTILTNNNINGTKWASAFTAVDRAASNLQTDMQGAHEQRSNKTNSPYVSFSRAIHDSLTLSLLGAANASNLSTPVDVNDPATSTDNSLFTQARQLGFNVVVPYDGRDVITFEDVIFVPADFETTDTTALLKELATQASINKILKVIPAGLLDTAVDTYTKASNGKHYDAGQLETLAIAALMFDKNFQLKMLLATKKNDSTWGTKKVIEFITTLQTKVAKKYVNSATETTASGKPKRVLDEVSKRITERVIESLRDSIVIFNKTVARSVTMNDKGDLVVDKATEAVLSPEHNTNLKQDVNIKFSAMLDAMKSGKITITTEVKLMVGRLVKEMYRDVYTDTITDIMNDGKEDGPFTEKPSITALEAKILRVFSSGTINQRVDLHAIIVGIFSRTESMTENKLHWIPLNDSSLNDHPAAYNAKIEMERAVLGGQTILSVLNGTADYTKLAQQVLEIDVDRDFNTNEVTRHMILNHLFKMATDNRFAILPNGQLVKTDTDVNDLVDSIATSITNNTFGDAVEALRDTKKNRVLKLQDFFKLDLGKVGTTPMIVTDGVIAHGYYSPNGVIHITYNSMQGSTEDTATFFHEMIHAINRSINTDLRYLEAIGGAQALPLVAATFQPSLFEDVSKYIITNFPISARITGLTQYVADIKADPTKANSADKVEYLAAALYKLSYEENSARSVLGLSTFSTLGFSWKLKGNDMYFVSPDGKQTWKTIENMPVVPEPNLAEMVVKATTFEPEIVKACPQLVEIIKASSLDEVITIMEAWRVEAVENIEAIKNDQDILGTIIDKLKQVYPDLLESSMLRLGEPNIQILIHNMEYNAKLFELDIATHSTYTPGVLKNRTDDIKSVIKAILRSDLAVHTDSSLDAQVKQDLTDIIRTTLLHPLYNLDAAGQMLATLTRTFSKTLAKVDSESAPKSFNFGSYSFTNHTGRTYMLSQKVGNKFVTQEVVRDTLLPLKANQKPMLEDKAMRDKMLFVIGKKIEAAAKDAARPKEPEAIKKAPISKEPIWQWGPWSVKNYDDTHYVVSKDSDTIKADYDTEDSFQNIQVVSKKTLLPDTMLGAKGKPILSDSERSNLLDWLENDAKPFFGKEKQPDGTIKAKYNPNLSKKLPVSNIDEQSAPTKEAKYLPDMTTAVTSKALLNNPDFRLITRFLYFNGTPDLIALAFSSAKIAETMYILLKYDGLTTPLITVINNYVEDYLTTNFYDHADISDGTKVITDIEQARAYLVDELWQNAKSLVRILRQDKTVATDLARLNADITEAKLDLADRTTKETTISNIQNDFGTPTDMTKKKYKANRIFIPNKEAKLSNLSNWIKRGRPIQMHPDIAAFVVATTTDFDKLSKFFKVRIEQGTLTHFDMFNFIGTTSAINDYTWRMICKHIYKNDRLANMGPSMAKYFLDKDLLEEFAMIARLTDDENILNKVNTYAEFRQLRANHRATLKEDKPEFTKKYNKVFTPLDTWWSYDDKGKLISSTFVIDDTQLLPIFMRHFDGTLKSLDDIFTLAKVLAGKQLARPLREDSSDSAADNGKVTKISSSNAATENNATAKGEGGSWNWIDRLRQNVIDYEKTGYDPALTQDEIALEDLTPEDKFNMVYSYLMDQALDYTTKRISEQEKADADIEVTDEIDAMTEAAVDKLVNYILAEARNALDIDQAKQVVVDPDAPARKTLKDSLRNKLRVLTRRLAGRKVNYNRLAPEVQALITFSINKSTMNVDAYTNLSDAELIAVNDKVAAAIETLKAEQQTATNLEKTKAAIIRSVTALQNKQRLVEEREARVKAREKAVKEGKNLKEMIGLKYDTKIAKQPFTITGPSEINEKLQVMLNHTWDNSTTSKVKYMDDSVQTIQNIHTSKEFYRAHAAELSTLTLAEVEDITDWLLQAYLNTSDSIATQTFEATRFFILAYIYNETTGLFNKMNANLKLQLENKLKTTQTTAGTLLSLVKQLKEKLRPLAIVTEAVFNQYDYTIPEADLERLDLALSRGDNADTARVLTKINMDAARDLTPEKVTLLRKIVAVRSMSMTSSPMTWVRNIISNYALEALDPISNRIGNAFFPKLTAKTEATPTQYKMDKLVTKDIEDFITNQFVKSGFFDATIDQLSKYNPSQVLRHKKADESDLTKDMLLRAIYNRFYSESMFDSPTMNKLHAFLMKRLSDKNWVRRDAIKFIGKILAETGAHLDADGNIKTGVDKEVMKAVAGGFALATAKYMHSDNMFSHAERWLSSHSEPLWAVYKTLMPFATASWNWFKAAMRFNPIGLAQSIVKLTHLEQQILKNEALSKKGEGQIPPELTEYIIRRDMGSGIIGTIAFGFGAILAALGYISLEDDDWGTPRLQIGTLRVDVSSIFGSSSVLAGAAFVKTFQDTKKIGDSLDAMFEPITDGFFFTDILAMDANAPGGWFEWTKYQLNSVALSFIPSIIRYASGATYTGNYRANNTFQRAVVRIPGLGSAFNVPKRTNVYTGDQKGTMWDILHRLLPYFEVVTKSQAQTNTETYGLNKEELNGTYQINGVPFSTTPKETARINKLYGTLNSNDLVNFYADATTYRVMGANNKIATKRYSQMTPNEIKNALTQIFKKNSEIAKVSAWLAAGHTYYTNDEELLAILRKLGYTKSYRGNQGFIN